VSRPTPSSNGCAGSLQRAGQPLLVERLEQVVHRLRIERLDRVLGVCRHEDDVGRWGEVETFNQSEPVRTGHANIEEDEIWPLSPHQLARLLHMLGFAHDGHIGVIGQHLPKPLASQRLVIHQQNAHVVHGAATTPSG
jgi:hypothetical protein